MEKLTLDAKQQFTQLITAGRSRKGSWCSETHFLEERQSFQRKAPFIHLRIQILVLETSPSQRGQSQSELQAAEMKLITMSSANGENTQETQKFTLLGMMF